jgi:hypothetical protein
VDASASYQEIGGYVVGPSSCYLASFEGARSGEYGRCGRVLNPRDSCVSVV